MKLKQFGLPYMGGKKVLGKHFVNQIIKDNPNVKYFYDLFGGGGAISLYALQHPQIERVFYNEINEGVVSLLKKVTDKEFDFNNFIQWVDRDIFHKFKNGTDWYAGLLKTCWSFGYNQRDYLYGKSIEYLNKKLWSVIVNKNKNLFKEHFINEDYNEFLNFSGSIFDLKTKYVPLYNRKYNKDNQEIRLQSVNNIKHLNKIRNSDLEFNKLEFSNKSYEEVDINTPINETIIFIDPPYKNTKKYKYDVDHQELINYIKSSPYKIYVSSYEFDLPIVKEWDRRCSLSNNSRIVKEKLFCNKNIKN